ncbi:autophagy-related protein 2 homolog B [Euwallacea similis]|uniref:autophagy-related protein 2 homolog B n=1 Tax=Euwallacea similis TaxID=1736056 RepID=UPI00344CE214
MPWYDNLIPDYIKKNVCTCLIKRYLSKFIENEITRDQLNLDLYNGRATAERISLAVEALNELGETQNWPIEFVDGYIDKIHISIPWKSIFNNSTEIEICGLKVTVQPKQRKEDATSMFESMWNSMTSSIQLAEEFVKEAASKKESDNQSIEGIELFAQTIDTVARRIKIKLTDTIIQVEHLPKESEKGVGLLINIDCMEYYDDFSIENQNNVDTLDPSKQDSRKAYLVDSVTTKNVILKGIQLSTVEFSSGDRTVSRSLIREDSRESLKDDETFFETVETGSKETDSEPEITEEGCIRHVILCGKCFSNQEVKIRLKQSETNSGPKVAIELNLGSLVLFLSPRQFHILMELVDGFSSPDLEDNSNVNHKQPQPRPMTETDYERVEEQLGQLTGNRNFPGLGLLHGQGWSSGTLEESMDSEYLPMRGATSTMFDSAMSGFSSSMDSSVSSSMISSATDAASLLRRKAISNIDSDPTAEISHFQVRIAVLAVILLHEDLLVQSSSNEKALVWQMQSLAEKFFNGIDMSTFIGVVSEGFENVHKAFEKACNLNHLKLLASPLKLEGNETTTSSAFSIAGSLTASKFELSECLYSGGFKHIPIIKFKSPQSANIPSTARANLGLKFKHVQRAGKSLGRKGGPKTEVSVHLDQCSTEFDLSIVDRIACLLFHPPVCGGRQDLSNLCPVLGEPIVRALHDFKISCPVFNFNIRFPIPDFRPATDMSKPPWWERNVRSDFISLVLYNANFHTQFQTGQNFSQFDVDCKELGIFYHESELAGGVHIARAGFEDKPLSSMQNPNLLTKLSIKVFPQKVDDEEEAIMDPMTHSFYGAFENQGNPDPGPFGAKKVVHKSDTPHKNVQKDASEEQVIPGDNTELESFVKSTVSNAQILVEVSLPAVSVQLESKHIYELIYNRISNDLLLWEPQAPRPSTSKSPVLVQFGDLALEQNYVLANSGFHYESESDSSDEDITSKVFHSAYDRYRNKFKHTIKDANQSRHKKNSSQSAFVLWLNIEEGLVSLNPPVRDISGNVIPGQQGELALHVNHATMFIVSGYKGDKDLGYVCVQVGDAQLYHCDIQPTPNTSASLKDADALLGNHLFPTIYKSDQKSFTSSTSRGGDREMFTVALKIQANHETHHVKVITVSLGLNRATLRHKMGSSWISHLIDYFNVTDYPLQGYVPKDVLTELHLHIWDCIIDYRPLHLPLRSAISIGSFSISSHLTAAANTSTLTMIFEDCGLFLSEKAPPKDGVPSQTKVDLQKDYVNVIEIALFEISIKTTDKQSGINPHIDLRTSINMLNIRTCSDSGRALFQLLTYYINDGDLTVTAQHQQQTESNSSSPHKVMEDELLSLEQDDCSISKSQQEHISELLEEAMEETTTTGEMESAYLSTGAKLFYFPDEKETLQELPNHIIPQVTTDLGDINVYHFGSGNDQNVDEDFCFIGDDAILPQNGSPEITWFSQDVKIIENYMAKPDGKRDILAPPKNFPTPTSRYTLCDMSIVWQMYGGNDFKAQKKEEGSKKEVRFADKQLGDTVTFSNKDHSRVNFTKPKNDRTRNLSWIQKGGLNRDHSVLMELQLSKVRFSHEVYPDTSKQASRQVLSVFNVEVRDRLASSQINKFLYHYSSHALPKQSHSNMVLIKALHSRPDPKVNQQECDLKISLLPIRLNIDQDALFFMVNFFKELGGETVEEPCTEGLKDSPLQSLQSIQSHKPPIMTTSIDSEREIEQKAKEVVTENLILLESRYHTEEVKEESNASHISPSDSAPIYFRHVEFSKDVLIRLDYIGKRVDMSHGSIAGLLMGLAYLKCSEITLKRIVYRHGLLGFNKLIAFLLQEWIADIKKNQLSTILGGVGPMKAVLQLFQGVWDLFWLPIEQYQKDGRIVRGLQRGANSFTTSTAMAALELTSRLIYFIQYTAETAYDMLSPGPSLRTRRMQAQRKNRKKRYHQPQDIREGITNACMAVKEGLGETADNIVQVATIEKEQKGISGAVGAVMRQIPPTIVKQIIIVSDATNNLIEGVQSQLVPDARKEANEKWLSDS